MPARNFCELLDAMQAERRHKVDQRVHETIAAMPPDELHRVRQMTQARRAERLGVNWEVRITLFKEL